MAESLHVFNDIMVPPDGEVLLSQKKVPICTMTEEKSDNSPWCFTRAKVDVSAFKAELATLPPDDWDSYSAEHNVVLHRPAHDAWGIKKIIFTFCDDFLQKVRFISHSCYAPCPLLLFISSNLSSYLGQRNS